MNRRDFAKAAGLGALAAGVRPNSLRADVPDHLWKGYDFGSGPAVADRLNQGPFGVSQDEGFQTIGWTSPSAEHIRNFGLGLLGYTWEEGGPAVPVRRHEESLESAVEKMASLPFMDTLYIRCDWRDIQSAPGKLNLSPVWKLTFDAAKQHGLKVGFRVQLSSPNFEPKQLAMPDFLQAKVPLVKIGKDTGEHGHRPQDWDYVEPRYDHPEFQKAFREMNELLAAEYDGNPQVDFMDLMMYGFWGESHTNRLPNPFPDYPTAEKTFVEMTRLQMDIWKKTPLAVNTEPDISSVGNRQVQDMAARDGCWFRSDSIVGIEEPVQVEELFGRPEWTAAILEEGTNRQFNLQSLRFDAAHVSDREHAGLHVLDMNGNYWALWTEADNLRKFNDAYPHVFQTMHRRLGYRIRPSWIWQRKRYDTSEVICAFVNDGVAGVPGVLRLTLESMDGKVSLTGGLDPGQPYGGRLREAAFLLPKGMEGQQMKLRAEVESKGVRHPIRWACAQPLAPDGSYMIQLKSLNDPGWRKGI